MQAKKTARLIWACAFAVSMALGLGACAASEQSPAAGASGAHQASKARPSGMADGFYGSPWVSGIFVGNLPQGVPPAADDLYLHFNHAFIRSNAAEAPVSAGAQAGGELRAAIRAAIGDPALTNHEIEQLRIFYNQALNVDAREDAGAAEVQPYLQAVAATSSLDELEAVLLSDDFPFSPWIKTTISAPDMKSDMCITVLPNLMFSDPSEGADIYRNEHDATMEALSDATVEQQLPVVAEALQLASRADDSAQATERAQQFFDLEKAYAQEGDYLAKYLDAPYGAYAQANRFFSLDELGATCPNFPIVETLDKYGEAAGEGFMVANWAWLEKFDQVWTEENFELLRDMTMAKVLLECKDFIAPSYFAGSRATLGLPEPTAGELAFAACDRVDTFGHLLAKTYVERKLGEGARAKLEDLTAKLADTYVGLIEDTPWLSDESRERVIDKIENMAFNILYPEGGYMSFVGLELVPSSQGGTLLGNYLRLKAYFEENEARLIGTPARACAVWFYFSPTMANCFYDAASNSINIYPGYLTSARYYAQMSQEELLGVVGFAIAHEISHAFDYQGSQYSAFGEAQPIYLDADAEEFAAISTRLADYLSTIEVQPGRTVNGLAVSAEATADTCGLQALVAYAGTQEGLDLAKVFEHFAKSWGVVYPFTYARYLAADMHAPSNVRVNASAQMCDELYAAFDIGVGDAMYLAPEERILLWGPNAG